MALELFNQNPDFDFGEEFIPWTIDFKMGPVRKDGFLHSNLEDGKLTLMEERETGEPILMVPTTFKDRVFAYGLSTGRTDAQLRRKKVYDQKVYHNLVDELGWNEAVDPKLFQEISVLLMRMQDAYLKKAWDDALVIEKPNKTVESIEAFDARYELNEVCEELLDLLDELNDVREVNCYFTTLKTAVIVDLELDIWEKVNETRNKLRAIVTRTI